jgi:SAM-dependent methyltransferase
MTSTKLCKIMGDYGSDKGHEYINECKHNYTLLYSSLFEGLCQKKLRVFELGLGTNNPHLPSSMGVNGKPGASLRGWATYFPNAKVYGADIDRDILFEEDRIKTYYCNQLVPAEIKAMWSEKELWEPFDIIIEDGLHEFEANVCFFENSIHKLKRGGYYIIEDLTKNVLYKWQEKIKEWEVIYPEITFKLVMLPNKNNDWDNNLLVAHFNFMNGF